MKVISMYGKGMTTRDIRKLIYTTNPIESFNRGIREVTKTRSVFPTEDALLKLVFLAVRDIEKKVDNGLPGLGSNLFSTFNLF